MPLKIHQRGNYWHYRGTVEGQKHRGTTGVAVGTDARKSKAKAARVAQQIETDLIKSAATIKANTGGRFTFIEAAILYRKAGKADRFISAMEDYWQHKPVSEITSGLVRQAAIEIYPNASGSTRNRNVIVPTQAIINHAASLDRCAPIRVKRFKIEVKTRKPATWEWVQQFMAASNPNMGALCCFMFMTGARISEAVNLRWKDVDLLSCKALIRQTKVGVERLAHMPPELVEAIKAIPGERDPEGRVFKYSSRHTAKTQWNKFISQSGIDYMPFHSCRHGFATTLLHNGVDPITVAKLGGWADAQLVFKTYGHAMQDMTLSNLLTSTQKGTDKVHKIANYNGKNGLKVVE